MRPCQTCLNTQITEHQLFASKKTVVMLFSSYPWVIKTCFIAFQPKTPTEKGRYHKALVSNGFNQVPAVKQV